MIHALLVVAAALCVAANVPGMLQGYWWSWAAGVFCLLLFVANMAFALRRSR
jgi:hypothetical protein